MADELYRRQVLFVFAVFVLYNFLALWAICFTNTSTYLEMTCIREKGREYADAVLALFNLIELTFGATNLTKLGFCFGQCIIEVKITHGFVCLLFVNLLLLLYLWPNNLWLLIQWRPIPRLNNLPLLFLVLSKSNS